MISAKTFADYIYNKDFTIARFYRMVDNKELVSQFNDAGRESTI